MQLHLKMARYEWLKQNLISKRPLEIHFVSYSCFLQVIIIRQYHDAFFWPRQKYQEDYSILEILKQKECRISVGYQEQGESVALVPEGNSYYAHSEHVNQPFWKFDILGQPNGGNNIQN